MPTEHGPLAAWRAVATAAALALAAGTAGAQSSPWFVSGQVSHSSDDNLLRLADDQREPLGQSRSDTVNSLALIAGLDQAFGRQRLQSSLTLRDNKFDRNSRFDNQSYSGSLSLEWATAGRVSGELSASRARALSTFNADGIGVLTQRNDETTESLNAIVSVGLVTEWSLELGAGQRRVRNSLDLASVRARDLDQDNAVVGLAWRPSAALETTLSLRETRGRYPTFRVIEGEVIDDPFSQRGADLAVRWRPAGSSQFEARIGNSGTRFGRGGDRDFDGLSASLAWGWRASGKLGLNTRLSRERGQDNYPTAIRVPVGFFFIELPALQTDLRTSDTLRTQADWAATAKVAVTASLQFTRRDVDSRLATEFDPALGRQAQGVDDTTIAALGLRWQPNRWSLLGCDLRHEQRRADGRVTTGLEANSVNCYAQATIR
jgi:hypothetical protein